MTPSTVLLIVVPTIRKMYFLRAAFLLLDDVWVLLIMTNNLNDVRISVFAVMLTTRVTFNEMVSNHFSWGNRVDSELARL